MRRVNLARWSLTPKLLTLFIVQSPCKRTRERLLLIRDIAQGRCASRLVASTGRHIETLLRLSIGTREVVAKPARICKALSPRQCRRRHKPPCQKNTAAAADSASEDTASRSAETAPALRWTVRKLCDLIGCVRGQRPGRETVRRVLKDLGISWKKARKLLGRACKTRRADFVEKLRDLLHSSSAPDGPLLLFGDEAHLPTDADLGYGWAPRGQRLFVHSHSPKLSNKTTVFGAHALGSQDLVQLLCAPWANTLTACAA